MVAATLNRHFSDGLATGRFFTMVYGLLDTRVGSFRYVTAGHSPPVLIDAKETRICPLSPGLPIGIKRKFQYGERTVHLAPGDRLLLYTDGALEAVDASDEEWGEKRLLDALVELYPRPLEESLETMTRRIEEWCPGEEPQDDITLLAVEVREG